MTDALIEDNVLNLNLGKDGWEFLFETEFATRTNQALYGYEERFIERQIR